MPERRDPGEERADPSTDVSTARIRSDGLPARVSNPEAGTRRSSARARHPIALRGRVERFIASASGRFLICGWLSDEGCDAPRFQICGHGLRADIDPGAVLRCARPDIEARIREGAYDYGFVIFGRVAPHETIQQAVRLEASTATTAFEGRADLEIVADKRLLDIFLVVAAGARAHAGSEVSLHAFLLGGAGDLAVDLFRSVVARGTAGHHVERFRPRAVARSFVTVLFGSVEPIMMQPILFRQSGIDFGEWIYVCNSPEDASAALRSARTVSELYDLAITVIVMADNVGFGAANNVAVAHASSDEIYLINPDVYPLHRHAAGLNRTLEAGRSGDRLCGGLLFYDDHTLMHSGMFVERDLFLRSGALNRGAGGPSDDALSLLRVEHFDKGVPFVEGRWGEAFAVPAITGALMAFERDPFERLGGFSARYIYGHYEDADLSLRWGRGDGGSVCILPGLRLSHLEGQGSRPRGEQYRSAAIINRHLFTLQHGGDQRSGVAGADDTHHRGAASSATA